MKTISIRGILTVVFAAALLLIPSTAIAQSDGGGKKKKKKTRTEQTSPAKKPAKNSLAKSRSVSVSNPDGHINGHGYVNLGLPSGLKWATCNVGASSPSDYGSYFAWGETTTKSSYTEENSRTYNVDLGDISGDPNYDAARANWGSTWRMPTKSEFEELLNKCKWTWTTSGGKKGYKIVGPNGNSIFFPSAGSRLWSSLYTAGARGYYWSSAPDSDSKLAYYLFFDSSDHEMGWYGRYYGRSVRPVSE